MANLKWNELECGCECDECGAIYSEEEVARCWGYAGVHESKHYVPSYCMDCGSRWDEFTGGN